MEKAAKRSGTPEGEEYLNALIREYRRYTGAVDQILGLTEGGKGA